MIDYQKYESERKKLHESSKKDQLIGGILIALAVIVLMIAVTSHVMILIILVFILGVAGAIYFSKAQKAHSAFRKIVKMNIIKNVLEEVLEDVSYEHASAINIDRINQVGMVKKPDRVRGEDYVKARYKGVTIETSDYTLLERVVRRDSKGNQIVTYEPYFKGRWLIYTFNRTFNEVLKISETRPDTKKLERVETESIVFNKKFQTYASSQQFAFYHITPSVLEKLLELENIHKGTIAYCIKGQELHVGINDNRNYFELSINKEINEKSLSALLNEVDLIAAIINELKLDSPKYNQ